MNAQPAILSIAVFASFALAMGGAWLVVKRRDRKRGVLMIVMALVLLANILLWALPVPAHGAPPLALPGDVRAFIDRRDSCDHWRDEDGYDPAREREIRHAVELDCRGMDRTLAALRQRYARRGAIVRALAIYEDRIELPLRPLQAR